MEETMMQINVEQIMEEIRENIKRRGYTDDFLEFEDIETKDLLNAAFFDFDEMLASLQKANMKSSVNYYCDVIPHRGVKNLVKAVIRKFLRFLFMPIIEEQNQYNAYSVRMLNQVALFAQEQIRLNEEMKRKLEAIGQKEQNQ